MRIAHLVLVELGASRVFTDQTKDDPRTEEEFNTLDYDSKSLITWQQYQEKYETVSAKYGTRILRGERDRRLQATDWIMTVDNAQSLENLNDWIAYRQALRDLPENPPAFVWSSNGNLDFSNMDMPVQPPIIRKTQ